MDNIINKRKLILKALLRVLEAEFFGLFVFLFFWAMSTAIGVAANIIFSVVGILMLICIMADYGLKTGAMCRNKVNLHGAQPCRNLGYILLGILIISKSGAIGNFLPAYKLLNACFFPVIDLVAPTPNISEASPILYIIMAAAPLFYLISLGMSFRWGYDSVDLKTKIMYKNK